jgi:hypothetical protein
VSIRLAIYVSFAATAWAGDGMPVAQQNAIVQKYCVSCHTDAEPSGLLSLQHYDAAHAAPALSAMLLSKVTAGVPLATVKAAASDANAAALVARQMRHGAMGAAGIGVPDQDTIDAFIQALASGAGGAEIWQVRRGGPATTATVVRELSPRSSGEATTYRLTLSCNAATKQREALFSWAPSAANGPMSVAVDGGAPLAHEARGAAIDLTLHPRWAPFQKTVRVSGLFPNEAITFAISDLPVDAREALAACDILARNR